MKPVNILSLISFVLVIVVSPNLTKAESTFSLNGQWQFALDANDEGIQENWFANNDESNSWEQVSVSHTWQVDPQYQDYMGIAWYIRTIDSQPEWEGNILRLEFEAVYRDATIWINGEKVGEHNGSGWTPFSFLVNEYWNWKDTNTIAVRVDNRFSANAIPYKDSFDWPADGGIIRDVRLRILPKVYLDNLLIDSVINEDCTQAQVKCRFDVDTMLENSDNDLSVNAVVFDSSGNPVLSQIFPVQSTNQQHSIAFNRPIQNPTLWHFDHPQLYTLQATLIANQKRLHQKTETFGIRKVEVKDGFYFLNNEPMRLMGVEWMPGSDPRYGMAQDSAVMRNILEDMKKLNCIITRFHWQQDDAVFEFCDQEGMLVQEEIPAWGGRTMEGELSDIQAMQTREMVIPHYNHPSIYAWGICNEIQGLQPKGHDFIQHGKKLIREIDPHRLLTYASNSIHSNPKEDASQFMDFIEWNDYWESWYKGGLADLENSLDSIKIAYPKKSLVISEYGLCECSPDNPVGDPRRIEILRTHTDLYRKSPNVAGAIFFSYNDYRTHIGDKGQGSFQQRVHGVVDLFSKRKPSWDILRRESSPIKTLNLSAPIKKEEKMESTVTVETRSLETDFPSYILRDYLLVWVAYNQLDQPIGTGKRTLSELHPGKTYQETISWESFEEFKTLKVEIFRPTGYSVIDTTW